MARAVIISGGIVIAIFLPICLTLLCMFYVNRRHQMIASRAPKLTVAACFCFILVALSQFTWNTFDSSRETQTHKLFHHFVFAFSFLPTAALIYRGYLVYHSSMV